MKRELKIAFIITTILITIILTIVVLAIRKNTVSLPINVEIRNRFTCFECRDYYILGQKLEEKYKDNPNVKINYYNSDISQSYFNAYAAALSAGKQQKFWQYIDELYKTEQPYSENSLINIAKGIGLDIEKFNSDRESQELINQANENLQRSIEMGNGQDSQILINNKLYTDRDAISLEYEINLLLEKAK